MSLNGLNDESIQAAHAAALTELGGWYVAAHILPSRRARRPTAAIVCGPRGESSVAELECPLANPGSDCQMSLLTRVCPHRFLLKYASRDEIVLLGLGTGGIVEIRNNIAQHEDVSPLFGFLRYRRRSVVIKYIPEECSRLVQGECSHSW